jgi:uncharacterized membrane protein
MRVGFVVVGVVLILLAAVLMFVPLFTVSSETVPYDQVYTANVTGFSITGTIAGTLTWSTSSAVDFFFFTCSAVTNDHCSGTNTSTNQSGTGGTFTFNVKPGGAIGGGFIMGAPSASVTVKLAQDTIGLILLILGILLLLIGAATKRKMKSAPSTPPPTPTSPPPSP